MPPPTPKAIRLDELAARVGAAFEGDGGTLIDRVATLENAGPGAIAFLANPKYRAQLTSTHAAAVIVAPGAAVDTALPKLVVPNPYATYAKVAAMLNPAAAPIPGVHAFGPITASAATLAVGAMTADA